MPDTSSDEYGNIEFFVSPLIQGLKPWQYNMASMGGSHSTTVKDGVLYRIMECDDIALFADRRIYLCITDTTFYPTEAYNYNETDGTITRNESYEGINLLMDRCGYSDESAEFEVCRRDADGTIKCMMYVFK